MITRRMENNMQQKKQNLTLILTVLGIVFIVLAGCKGNDAEQETNTTLSCNQCLGNYYPVCTTENVTYDNSCIANCSGKVVAYDGICTNNLTYCGGINHTMCPEGQTCSVKVATGRTDEGYCYQREEPGIGCGIDGITHYVKKGLIYHADNQGRSYIEIPKGTYIQVPLTTSWKFYASAGENEYYNTTITAIQKGNTTWGSSVVCSPARVMPTAFERFFETHSVK